MSSRSEIQPIPALLVPAFADAFRNLGISVSVFDDRSWRAVHLVPSAFDLEVEHGVQPLRHQHNMRCISKARRSRRPVVGRHAGLSDLFVPVLAPGRVRGVVVAGPFATVRPTSAEILEHWHAMTRRHGRLSDPGFAAYLDAMLDTATLRGRLLGAFQHLLEGFARFVAGTDMSDALMKEVATLGDELIEARFTERMWAAARSMVDDRTTHIWSMHLQTDPRTALGLEDPPEHAIVGSLLGSPDADPVADALRRDAFQRACVDLARRRRHVVSGRVGRQGVTFLVEHDGSRARTRATLLDVATRATALARRFGFRLHAGIAAAEPPQTLAARYRAALGAAENALARGAAVTFAQAHPDRASDRVRQLRRALGEGMEAQPHLLSTRFDGYVEAVLTHCGYQVEAARAHLEAGVDRLTEPLLSRGLLDAKSLEQLYAPLEGAAGDANDVMALVGVFRRMVADIERSLEQPTNARQDRSLRRALDYVREHLAEPLTLTTVARVAGFAPDYFSRLLKREDGRGFDTYVRELRLERAKQMLTTTSLSVDRVAQLSGYRSRTYFQRLFKQSVGATPRRFRRSQASLSTS